MNKLLLVSAIGLVAAVPAQARHHAAAMKWMDSTAVGLPAGAQVAVVSGNPMKDGPFVVAIKMPANYAVPPHHHPTDEVVRVTSAGTLSYGMGDKLNRSNAGSLTKGYHVAMQAGMNHYVFTSDPLDVQVSGTGPFAITYVDPKDDPRTK